MALFGEVRHKASQHSVPGRRLLQQVLLVPEAVMLLALVVLGWMLHFPALIGLLAIITMLVFAVRLSLIALAERRLARGAYDAADRLLRAALRLNPWSADALVLRAQGLTQQGEDEAAERFLRQATRLYPDDPALQSALAAVLLAQGRIAEGWQMARQNNIVALDSPQIVQQRAWLALHVEDDAAKARSILQSSHPERQAPQISLPLLATLCEAQIVLGAHDEALKLMQTIEEQLRLCAQPQQAELLYHLGKLHMALGQDGTLYFRRSVELDPDGRYAQAAWRSAVNPAA